MTPLERLPDWEPRLAAYLSAARDLLHEYGRHDCLMHVADAILAVTGTDLGADHRGRYTTEQEARAYLRGLGYRKPKTLLDSLLPERSVARARRGDIVLDDEDIPGVCIGGDALMVACRDGREGLFRVPRSAWARAWSVG